jgi:hypothetical protein
MLSTGAQGSVPLPKASDWANQGVAVRQSKSGWDSHFAGHSPSCVVRKNGTFFLYYIGSSGPRSTDGNPKDRALGVATSRDGITFQKYSGNPIIRHQPHKNQEEGIISAACTLDDKENIVLYYGAIWAANSTTESVDVYVNLAISNDGLHFVDHGRVASPPMNGGENWPFAVLYSAGNTTKPSGVWHVWHGKQKPNGLLSGNSSETINRSSSSNFPTNTSYAAAALVPLGEGDIAMFHDRPIKVHIAKLHSLDAWDGPIVSYKQSQGNQGLSVLLDRESRKWFMYVRMGNNNDMDDTDEIRVWVAPAEIERLFPQPPTNVRVDVVQ